MKRRVLQAGLVTVCAAGLSTAIGCGDSSTSDEGEDFGIKEASVTVDEALARCGELRFRISRARCERAVLEAAERAEAEEAVDEQPVDEVPIEPPVDEAPLEEPADEVAGAGFCCDDGDCLCHEEVVNEETATDRGPFAVDTFTVSGRQQFGGGTVFFPTNAEPPFSVFVMCPGFTARQSSIRDWGPFFASHGMVMMTMDTLATDDPVVSRDDQLLAALRSLEAENARGGGPLQGALALERMGVAGWSMGGGGSWLAGQATPELRSVLTLAGHHRTAGGARGVASNLRVPTLMMAGSDDPVFLGGGGQSQDVFELMDDDVPKMLYEVDGAGHFVWGTPRTNGGAVGRYALSWQKVFLDGDDRYLPLLQQEGPNASDFRSNL